MSGPLALALALLCLYWLWRVGAAARRHSAPRVAWWGVPGLAALLLAPLLDVPALFGLGAALLLIAEYWPAAFTPVPERPGVGWPLVGGVLGAGLAVNVLRAEGGPLVTALAVSGLLWGAGGLLSAALYRARPVVTPLGFQARWNRTVTPDWPALSVRLSGQGAHLKNVSGGALRVAGWSPAGVNGWYPLRTASGEALSELRSGQEALLPVSAQDSGVRVWYVARGAEATQLFRADWTPPAYTAQRVLN